MIANLELPFEQGSVQFILMGIDDPRGLRRALGHDLQVAPSPLGDVATACPRRFTSASVAFRCS